MRSELHDRRIGLSDANNFFVSCERCVNPALNGRPVVVLSGNDGCVIARSNEVKLLGVPMGAPYFQYRSMLAYNGVAKQNGKIVVKSKGAESPQIQHFWKVTINQNICRT